MPPSMTMPVASRAFSIRSFDGRQCSACGSSGDATWSCFCCSPDSFEIRPLLRRSSKLRGALFRGGGGGGCGGGAGASPGSADPRWRGGGGGGAIRPSMTDSPLCIRSKLRVRSRPTSRGGGSAAAAAFMAAACMAAACMTAASSVPSPDGGGAVSRQGADEVPRLGRHWRTVRKSGGAEGSGSGTQGAEATSEATFEELTSTCAFEATPISREGAAPEAPAACAHPPNCGKKPAMASNGESNGTSSGEDAFKVASDCAAPSAAGVPGTAIAALLRFGGSGTMLASCSAKARKRSICAWTRAAARP